MSNNEHGAMTPQQRAALAEAREAEAQRRKAGMQAAGRPAQPKPAQPKPAQPKPVQPKPAQPRPAQPKSAQRNTQEYIKPTQPAAKKPPVRTAPKPETPQKESDTGEFPSYVRKGKGGYRPPKPKARRATRHRRLDARFLGVICAAGALLLTVAILLLCGVRYQTYRLTDGAQENRYGQDL